MGILVGREAEAAWLAGRLAAPVGSVSVVWGEAGVGKTSLVDEVVSGHEMPIRATFPASRVPPAGFGLRRLAASGGSAGRALAEALDGGSRPGRGDPVLAISRAADELVAALVRRIVVLDDLQWADDLTLGWLAQTGELLGRAPLRFVLLVRAVDELPDHVRDALAPLQRHGLVADLHLEPLSTEGVSVLARELGHRLDASTAVRIHARAGGLPLAVKDLLGQLDRRASPPGEASAATAWTAMVREQLTWLTTDARTVVRVAALAPPAPSESLVRAACGLPPERFDAAVEDALVLGLMNLRSSGALTFRHELQRETIQQTIGLAERRALHRRLADCLRCEAHPDAAEVADQLLEAGDYTDALGWQERAATDAARGHDHGTALARLGVALRRCRPDDDATIARLTRAAVTSAHRSHQPDAGLQLLDAALDSVHEPACRGDLLLGRARLLLHQRDYGPRYPALLAAREAFAAAGEDRGAGWALAGLALPVGSDVMTIDQHLAFGREGLRLAGRLDDPLLTGCCAGALALAEMFAGQDSSGALWEQAEAALSGLGTPEASAARFSNRLNRAIGTLAAGHYDGLVDPLAEDLARAPDALARRTLLSEWAIRRWRLGDWDGALDAVRQAQSGPLRSGDDAIATVVGQMIAWEREPQPDVAPLVEAAARLRDEYTWGPMAHALVMSVRAARREPRPDRDLDRILERIVRSGARIGLDELLPVAARLGAGPYRRARAILGGLDLVGPRAEASWLLAEGLAAARSRAGDPSGVLQDAADAYEALGDPFATAQALEVAASTAVASGRRAGALRRRAAELYADLGADRSLATLIRGAAGSRALEGFSIPASQRGGRAPGLTPRERDVADLARLGVTARGIGEELGIATGTVVLHLQRIKRKLGAATKADLVRLLADG